VIEVELDLIGGRTNRLITSELKLSDQILVGVLGETSALIRVQKHVINVQRGSNKRLVIRDNGSHRSSSPSGISLGTTHVGVVVAVQTGNSPQALINGTNVKVDLDLVVLEGDQRKGKTGVGAKPELKGNVEGGLRKSISGSAHLTGSDGVARTINISERGVGDKSKLSGVTNHLKISTLLFGSHGELIPDVHPITVLTVNALASDLNLNLSDKLFSGVVQPSGINTGSSTGKSGSVSHKLVNLGKSNLKVGSVGKIAVSADNACNTATEIGLSVESLFNRLNSKVSVTSVGHLPKGDLRIASKINILSSIGHELHKSASHFFILFLKKIIFWN
jgi:hypothetical protein